MPRLWCIIRSGPVRRLHLGPSSDLHMPLLNASVAAEDDSGTPAAVLDTVVWVESSSSLVLT